MHRNPITGKPSNEVGGEDIFTVEPTEPCPRCGGVCHADFVDNGYGPYAVQAGPFHCEKCGWIEGTDLMNWCIVFRLRNSDVVAMTSNVASEEIARKMRAAMEERGDSVIAVISERGLLAALRLYEDRAEAADRQSYDDLAASGGLPEANQPAALAAEQGKPIVVQGRTCEAIQRAPGQWCIVDADDPEKEYAMQECGAWTQLWRTVKYFHTEAAAIEFAKSVEGSSGNA